MKKQNENQNGTPKATQAAQATETKETKETTEITQEISDSDKEKKQRKIIVILAILLALSAAGLAVRYLYLHHLADTPVTIEIPDNLVGEKEDVTNGNGGSGTNNGAGFVVPANASGNSGSKADQNGNTDENDNSGSNKSDQDDPNNPGGNTDDPSNPDDNTDDPNNPDNPNNPDDPSNPGDNTGGNTGTGGSSGRTGTRIDIFEGNNFTKTPFEVKNMFPGDGYRDDEAKFYCIRIYHSGATTLYFKATVTNTETVTTTVEGGGTKITKPLAENLHLKVVNLGTSITNPNGAQAGTAGITHAVQNVICDNTFSNVDGTEHSIGIPASASGVTDVYFQINGYLPTTTGNDCQSKHLAADFEWYVKDAGGGGGGGTVTPTDPDKPDNPDDPSKPDDPDNLDEPDNPDKPDKPDKPTKPDKPGKPNQDGNLTKPPKTGDAANLTLWSVMAASALLLLIITVKTKRKEDAEDDKQC